MVTRSSQPAQFGGAGDVSIQQSNEGYKNPNPDQYGESSRLPGVNTDTSSLERVLSNVLQVGGKLAEVAVSHSREEAYLRGSAAVGTAKSEQDLNENILTRAWATAGFRDTTGRLAAANMQAEVASDMHTMREKSPEEFNEYLAQKRQAVLDSFQGMSLDTRKTMFAQQMMNDRAAIQKHQVEHYKFVVDQENKSVNAAIFSSLQGLGNSKDDAESYRTATDATFMTGYSAIVSNPKLPPEMKAKLVGQFAEQALSGDNQALFLKMQSDQITLADGSKGAMLQMAAPEDQIKLSNMYRDSLKRTEGFRASSYMDQWAKTESDWSNPLTPLQSPDEVRAFLNEGVQKNYVNADQFKTSMAKYYTASEKKAVQANLGAAWAAGDTGKMVSMDKTPQEGLDAYMAQMGRKMSVPELTNNLMNIGIQTGQEGAFKKVGELLAPAFVQLGLRKEIDPSQAAGLAAVLGKLEDAKTKGLEGAYTQFLGAFSPEAQAKVTYMRDSLKNGMDPVSAITAATAKVAEEAALTPALRAELSASKAKDIKSVVDEITPRGYWDTATLFAHSMLPTKGGANAGAELAIRPFEGWFENTGRVNEVMATGKLELLKKMNELSVNNPSLPPNSLKENALANIRGRTVPTTWGPLIIPDGFTPQRYFGVDNQVPNDRIGSAMAEYIKPKDPENRMAFSVGVSGELVAKELNTKGQLVSSQTMDPKVLAPIVAQQQAGFNQRFDKNQGDGVTKWLGNGNVQFNGNNTANTDPEWMRQWRESVIDNNIVKLTVSDPKNSDAVSAAFKAETNAAAATAQRLAVATSKPSQSAFNFYANMVMADANFNKQPVYKAVLKSVVARDSEGALKSLRDTPMYKNGSDTQRALYERQLQATMKD